MSVLDIAFHRRRPFLAQPLPGARLEAAAAIAAKRNGASLYYVPQNLSGIYQDSAGTTAVTVVGQAIGFVKDRVGSYPVSQSTYGYRPTLTQLTRADGGKSWAMLFDGVDDYLAASASIIGSTLTQPYTMIAAVVVGAVGSSRRHIGDSARNMGYYATGSASLNHIGGTNPTIASASVYMAGTVSVLSGIWDGSTGTLFENGVPKSASMAAPTTGSSTTKIGQSGSGSQYFNSAIALICVCPSVIPDADRKSIERFGAYLSGATYNA